LFIGSPERANVNGDWAIMLSRPLIRDNIVRGVVAAEVPIAMFSDLFNALVATGATRVSLMRDNGILIASEPDQQQAIGRVPKFAAAVLAAAAEGPTGVLEVSADEEGDGRLRRFRRVPGVPQSSRRLGAVRHAAMDEWTASMPRAIRWLPRPSPSRVMR
jgi:hypothetical protein